MNKKRGITVVTLSVAVIVICILVTSIIVKASYAKEAAKNITLLNEIQSLQSASKQQLATTGTLPVTDENMQGETAEEILNKVPEKDAMILKSEIEANKDMNDIFLRLDLTKIASSTVRGIGKTSSRDYFYITKGNLNVYYLEGLKLETGKIFTYIDEDKVEEVIEESAYQDVNKTISIEKESKYWNNEIEFKINTTLEDAEKLFVQFLNDNGLVIYFKDITEIAHARTYKISKDLAEDSILNSVSKVRFILKNGNNEIARKEIELKNLDITRPQLLPTKMSVMSVEDTINANIYVQDSRSGADKLVYINILDLEDIEEDEKTFFILNKGKTIQMKKTENACEYVAEIKGLQLGEYVAVCIDKAGNILENIYIK